MNIAILAAKSLSLIAGSGVFLLLARVGFDPFGSSISSKSRQLNGFPAMAYITSFIDFLIVISSNCHGLRLM
jgi:hypothetical protein